MPENTYKMIELTGTSAHSIEDAIAKALSTARKLEKNLRWFVVTETRGAINDDKVAEYQVTIKVGCRSDP